MNKIYSKNGFYILIAVFIAWILISSIWYICGIKGLCQEDVDLKKNDAKVVIPVEEQERYEVISRKVVKKKVTCTPYLELYSTDGKISDKNEVAKVQEFFNSFEDQDLDIDGVHGGDTTSSIKKFQEINEIYISGIIDGQTAELINKIYCKNEAEKLLKK